MVLNYNLERTTITRSHLKGSIFIETNVQDTIFENCHIFGISAWKINGEPSTQTNLNISDFKEIQVTVNNFEIAQFIYLILNNVKIRGIINAITTKVVLILGRFSDDQKSILDMLRIELPKYDYVPIVFDFIGPETRDLDETISILFSISKFVIADLTDPRSIPQELKGSIERMPSIPVQPIIRGNNEEYGMFEHFQRE